MDSILSQLSASTTALGREAALRLFHVPSPLGGRTALGFDGRRLLVPAREAEEGEEVEVIAPGGIHVPTKVVGFDPALGLAVLELTEALPASAWELEPSPAAASLVLAAAYPSEDGPEFRLDLLRIASGGAADEDAYLQTDGAAFPGFGGAALVAPSGRLAGVVAAEGPGNRGWAIPAERARALVEALVAKGFPSRAWLGVSTLPIEVPEVLKALMGGRDEAVMVVGVEAGSPAAKAGLLPGDILSDLGGKPVEAPEGFREAIAGLRVGVAVPLGYFRGGVKSELSITPAERARDEGGSGEEGCCGGQGGRGHHGHGHHGPGHHGHQGHGGFSGRGGGPCGCGTDR